MMDWMIINFNRQEVAERMSTDRSFKYVNKSQINKSRSKETHAFSKSNRFPKVAEP